MVPLSDLSIAQLNRLLHSIGIGKAVRRRLERREMDGATLACCNTDDIIKVMRLGGGRKAAGDGTRTEEETQLLSGVERTEEETKLLSGVERWKVSGVEWLFEEGSADEGTKHGARAYGAQMLAATHVDAIGRPAASASATSGGGGVSSSRSSARRRYLAAAAYEEEMMAAYGRKRTGPAGAYEQQHRPPYAIIPA
jgi:hypothetical protein